ncbi:hypothetical protein HDC92_001446 [Pedobacter sp. AK017]|uniref:hypothetical protein n=1 Tax=Pedobacter sp. AK017 TaxID=2723073 RepID=UPI00160FD95D|nr:hypothetical protein [Pedobacter sp. AK017]MBB5437772.1 hypothetical protein [Pedobacter sp. AK017]
MNNDKISGLEILRHGNNYFSIKDLNDDIDISKKRWNILLEMLIDDSSCIYFHGIELNYTDDNLTNIVSWLNENILVDDSDTNNLLFKIKASSILLSRNLVSTLWNYYWSPSLIFMNDRKYEDLLRELIEGHFYVKDILEQIEGIKIIYMGAERDVLWLQHNFEDLDQDIIGQALI